MSFATATTEIFSTDLVEHVERAPTADQAVERVETRFGCMEIRPGNLITMARGPHGFVHLRRFALLNIPGAESGAMKLFQALGDPAVGFIVIPLSPDSQLIATGDRNEARQALGSRPDATAILLVITIRSIDGKAPTMTANLRAPLVVDTDRRIARQHIFTQSTYDMRHPL